MSESLIIRLSAAADAPAEWLVVDAFGARIGSVGRGPLSAAAQAVGTRKVIVLVPGTDVLLTHSDVPARSGAKLSQMVAYSLEEQLVGEVDSMHFSTIRRNDHPGVSVAVTAHERMVEWRAQLQAAGIFPAAIYADASALPANDNGITLLVDENRVYVRHGSALAHVLEVEPLIEAVQLGLESSAEGKEHVTIYMSPETYERERDLFEGLREFTASLQLKLLPDGPLPLLAPAVVKGSLINLLQGRYAEKRKLSTSFAPWRRVAIIVGVLAVTHLGAKILTFVQLKKTEANLDAQITTLYQMAMPGQPLSNPADARAQVEARLGALRGAGASGGFLAMLSTVGAALAQTPDTHLEVLRFQNSTTDLRLLAPSVDAIDHVRNFTTQRGLATEIQGTNPRDSKTEGRLQLKPART